MAMARQFSALLRKNLITMRRNLFSSLCQILFPIVLFFCIFLIRNAIKVEEFPVDSSDPLFARYYSSIYPTYADNTKEKVDKDNRYLGLNVTYPFANCELQRMNIVGVVGNGPIIENVKSSIKVTTKDSLLFKEFNSLSEMFNYVASDDYGFLGSPQLCFGFAVSEISSNNFEYSLSYYADDPDVLNTTRNVPTTEKASYSPFSSRPDFGSFQEYKTSGFLYMMNLISNKIAETISKDKTPPRITSGVLPFKFISNYNDNMDQLLQFIVPFFVIVIFMIPFILLIFRMVKDKESRNKEGMKIMGMSNTAYFLSYFVQYLIINFIISVSGTIIISNTLNHIHFLLRFLILFLYGLSVFSIAYMIQSFSDKSSIGLIVGIMTYYIMFFISPAVINEEVTYVAKMFASLLSPTAFQLGFFTIAKFQTSSMDLTFNELSKTFGYYSTLDMLYMLIVDTLLYLFIGFYCENVLPQQYGTRKSPWFLCSKSYWFGLNKKEARLNTVRERLSVAEDSLNDLNSNDFQSEADYIGRFKEESYIQLKDVKKTYDDGKQALKGVTLNLYKNEIFALLGHNGAGKSTLINILTGLYESSGGSVEYGGENIFDDIDSFRKKVGICPQHDVLFEDITVKEHLELFSSFKGVTDSNLDEEIKSILQEMELLDKIDEKSQNLSGGQKRKLSIAIALIGRSEIIFLDEPSSGMDITNRRKMWDILKRFTKDRIIVLTTHYMEEASVLGNRIGILSGGKLKCIGTPLFLINRFGKNIQLTLVKLFRENDSKDQALKDYTTKKFLEYATGDVNLFKSTISFENLTEEMLVSLPKNQEKLTLNYKLFFEDLDQNLQSLGIRSYSASMPTLEDVFLFVSDEIKKGIIENYPKNEDLRRKSIRTEDESVILSDQQFVIEPGLFSSVIISLKWCLTKRFIQGIRNKSIFVMEVICPIILVLIGIGLNSVKFVSDAPVRTMELANYPSSQISLLTKNSYYQTDASLIAKLKSSTQQELQFSTVEIGTKPIVEELSQFNNLLYDKFSRGLSKPAYDDPNSRKYFGHYFFLDFDLASNNYEFITLADLKSRDSSIIMTQAMINSIYSSVLESEVLIKASSAPFPLTKYAKGQNQVRNSSNLVFFLGIGFALIPASFITFIVREKQNNKHLQIISGVSLLGYWSANILFELAKYYLTGGLILLIIYLFNDYKPYLWALYLLYGYPMIVISYLSSFIIDNESAAQNLVVSIFFVFGALGGSIIFFLRLFDSIKKVSIGLGYLFRAIPLFCFSNGYSIMLSQDAIFFADNPGKPLSEKPGILSLDYVGMDILYLCFSIVIYTILLIVGEILSTQKSVNKYLPNEPKLEGIVDKVVLEEIRRANESETANDGENGKSKKSIKVKNIEKTYKSGWGCNSKSTKAINNVSFTVDYGECFAMLGINGAGKSSMFKSLTKEIFPEKGDIEINGLEISSQFTQIRSMIGYCPQIDAIFEDLTVLENLEFYSSLKKINENKKVRLIKAIMHEMNLDEFVHKRSGNLSGGNKRKLSVAIALIGNPLIILLDEPSAGMDPEARRFMWNVIHKKTKESKKSSVILTTHSMEEAETLCQKIGIMVNGQFKCIGSATTIKETYGSGFELFISFRSLNTSEMKQFFSKKEGLNEESMIKNDEFISTFKLIVPELNSSIVHKYSLGNEILLDLNQEGEVSASKLLNWAFTNRNLLQLIKKLNEIFKEITIIEYWGNTFKIKLNKQPGKSIGYVFGLVESMKSEFSVSEYSVSQTSLEQIFNQFANESIESGESSINYKPKLEITNDFLAEVLLETK